jgi:putative methyltransferase (TIGR04325 family)
LAALIAPERDRRLNVLDFGGGTAFQADHLRYIRPTLNLNWTVVEVPTVVAESHTIDIPGLTFTDDLDAAATKLGHIDLVHTSGTIQCVDDPRGWLRRLTAIGARHFFVGRASFHEGESDVIGVQRSRIVDHGIQVEVPEAPEGYVEYPFTYMAKADFDAIMAESGYSLVASFDSNSGSRSVNDFKIIGGAFLYRKS